MRKIALMIVSIAVLMATFFTTPALAGVGVAMGPTTLEIPSALRGVEYQRTVTVFNPGNTEMDFSLRADGQASEWLSFYDWSTKAAIQDLTLAGLGEDYVLIGINIPSDAPNGTYTTTIYVESAPIENAGEMEIAAVMQASSVLTIQVSGDQIVSGEISSMSIKDTEIGLPVRLDVNFFNTGNIVVYPKIDWVISKDDTKLVELSYAETMVKPEAHAVIPVEWTDATEMKGDYSAQVTVSLDGKVITTEEISFKILSVGTLTKLGALSSLAYEGQAELGNMLKIQGSFNSTGQADTLAKLIAEIYYNDNLIDTIMSEQILVPAGQTGTLSAYFKPSDSGAYIVKGYASYDGKQTGMKEISFTMGDGLAQPVGAASTNGRLSEPGSSVLPIVWAVLAVLVIDLLFRRSLLIKLYRITSAFFRKTHQLNWRMLSDKEKFRLAIASARKEKLSFIELDKTEVDIQYSIDANKDVEADKNEETLVDIEELYLRQID